MKILNFGSLNIDYVYNVDHILVGGETQSATDRNTYPGGKGLNQTLAFARAGSQIWHAGAIGKTDGQLLYDVLKEANVPLDYLQVLSDVPSGHTFIQVDKNGQNCILVYGGANVSQNKEHVDAALANFSEGDFLILQNEINELDYIIQQARKIGLQIVLNPSPLDEKIRHLPLDEIDYFMINEIEAAQLLEINKTDCLSANISQAKMHSSDQDEFDQQLLDNLIKQFPNSHMVMTVGSRGAYYGSKDKQAYSPIFPVEVVDTTAAGDTFTGYFISSFAKGETAENCLRIASAASALAVSRPGAGSSIPTIDEVTEFLKEQEES